MKIGFLKKYREIVQWRLKLVVTARNRNAIHYSCGQSHYLESFTGKIKPTLVMRTDVANGIWYRMPITLFVELIGDS